MTSYEIRCLIDVPQPLLATEQCKIQRAVQTYLLSLHSPLPNGSGIPCVEVLPICETCDGSLGAVACHCEHP